MIESGSDTAANIKSHHNVGGLPEDLAFDLVEPLRLLFKDEVRAVGEELGLPHEIVWRQPFPGPGLGVRIIGEVTPERAEILRHADAVVVEEIRRAGLYRDLWQSFAVLPAVRSVGVMGDGRTYAYPIVIRAVTSDDAMTADWARLPYDLVERIASAHHQRGGGRQPGGARRDVEAARDHRVGVTVAPGSGEQAATPSRAARRRSSTDRMRRRREQRRRPRSTTRGRVRGRGRSPVFSAPARRSPTGAGAFAGNPRPCSTTSTWPSAPPSSTAAGRCWSWPAPGSGKTRVLTRRIAHLLATGDAAPWGILAITFTNKAADEMRRRVVELVGPAAEKMWVSTFHSACLRILRTNADRLGYRSAFTVYDDTDSRRLVEVVTAELGFDPKRLPARAVRA